MRRLAFHLLPALTILLALLSSSLRPVQADSTANDLIVAVNAVRASYGLVPYQVGPAVMKFAQDHADYMASTQSMTHQLADGSFPADHSMTENIAYGYNLTTDDIIQDKWGDELHMHTMIGYTQGYIGAGVSVADGNAYYSLIVINTGRSTGLKPGMATPATATKSAAAETTATVTPPAVTATVTKTAAPTEEVATIEYEVQSGDSVWGLAEKYDVSMDSIIALNDLELQKSGHLGGAKAQDPAELHGHAHPGAVRDAYGNGHTAALCDPGAQRYAHTAAFPCAERDPVRCGCADYRHRWSGQLPGHGGGLPRRGLDLGNGVLLPGARFLRSADLETCRKPKAVDNWMFSGALFKHQNTDSFWFLVSFFVAAF